MGGTKVPDRGEAIVISVLYGLKESGSAMPAPAIGYEVEILTPENMRGQRKNIPLAAGDTEWSTQLDPGQKVTWGTFL